MTMIFKTGETRPAFTEPGLAGEFVKKARACDHLVIRDTKSGQFWAGTRWVHELRDAHVMEGLNDALNTVNFSTGYTNHSLVRDCGTTKEMTLAGDELEKAVNHWLEMDWQPLVAPVEPPVPGPVEQAQERAVDARELLVKRQMALVAALNAQWEARQPWNLATASQDKHLTNLLTSLDNAAFWLRRLVDNDE